MKKVLLVLGLILLSSCEKQRLVEVTQELRIITVGSKATEIVCELGLRKFMVARDYHSLHPKSVLELPELGLAHSINIESFLIHKPTHLIIWDEIGSYKNLALKASKAGVTVLELSPKPGVGPLHQSITAIGKLFKVEVKAEVLVEEVNKDLSKVSEFIADKKLDGRGLFIFAKGMGTLLAAGQNTDAAEFMNLVNLETAINEFKDYKTLNAEVIIEANPKYLLMVHVGLESIGGIEKLKFIPGLSKTTAYIEKNVITLDKVCMEFGPRVGVFALEFARKLHKEVPGLKKEN